jgi:hypothetical protein
MKRQLFLAAAIAAVIFCILAMGWLFYVSVGAD